MKSSNSRITFISTARVIGILLVAFGHSYPFDISIPTFADKLRTFIYYFHMPLFICIGGYLAYTPNIQDGAKYIQKRAKRLLIPYIALSLIAFIPKCLIQQFLNDDVTFSFGYLIRTELVPRENVWGHFWYIPVIFAFGCLGVVLNRLFQTNKKYIYIVLGISVVLLLIPVEFTSWFALQDMKDNLFYYVLGMALAATLNAKSLFGSKIWILALPVAVLLSTISSSALGAAAIACLMIAFIFCVGTFCDMGSKTVGKTIERYSYTIYLLSWPAQAVVEVIFNKILHLPVIVTMGGMFLSGVLVPLVVVWMLNTLDKKINVKWLKTVCGM